MLPITDGITILIHPPNTPAIRSLTLIDMTMIAIGQMVTTTTTIGDISTKEQIHRENLELSSTGLMHHLPRRRVETIHIQIVGFLVVGAHPMRTTPKPLVVTHLVTSGTTPILVIHSNRDTYRIDNRRTMANPLLA